MDSVFEKAYAKLNISLDVSARREDGFHDMVMVMQTVSLCDELELTKDASGTVRAGSNLSYIPKGEKNLAVKAARLYLERIGESGQGISIRLKKRIPVGAGMGGGSADAAAVLRAMNRMYGERLSREELLALAGESGSDVPFCLVGGTMLARGRGELLSPLTPMPRCFYVICKPAFSISTPELFKKFDRISKQCHPDTAGLIKALEDGDLSGICRRMYNAFEDVDDRRMRTVADIKSTLLDFGAPGAMMTGTGSAVFGIFSDKDAARTAADALKKEYDFCCVAENVGTLLN